MEHKPLQGHNYIWQISLFRFLSLAIIAHSTAMIPAFTRVFTATACWLFDFVIFFLLI